MRRVLQADRVKILHVDNSFTFGGAINSLANLVEGLDDRFRSIVVSGQTEEELRRLFPESPVQSLEVDAVPWKEDHWRSGLERRRLFRTKRGRRVLGFLRALDWLIRGSMRNGWRLFRIGRRHGADLVHLNNNVESQLDGLLAARLLGVPCVAHARSFQPSTRAVRLQAALAHRHVAISTAIRSDLLELGAPPERIELVPDGIDLDKFESPAGVAEVKEEFAIDADSETVAFFGRLVAWKGVKEFVLAFAKVIEARSRTRAFVVGDPSDGDPDYLREIEQLVASMDLHDRIVFTGYRSDVPALMQVMDVVVHTSTTPEPFGMVIAEAMAAGKPVVASDSGGPRDIVEDGTTGFLVDATESAKVAEAILELLEDPSRAREMGEEGRKRARALYTHERYARKMAEIYTDLIDPM